MTFPAGRTATATRLDAASLHRLVVVTVLGFASGLPLALTGQAMQAWLGVEGIDIATIGFLSLVGLPYTFKFLWAPLMDRFELPRLGRRRGWLVVTQLALAAHAVLLAATPPKRALQASRCWPGGGLHVGVAGRGDRRLPHRPAAAAERGLGSSLNVLGYRLAMIVSGGIALIWTDRRKAAAGPGREVYRTMAWLMVGAAVFSLSLLPRLAPLPAAARAVAATTCSASSPWWPRWRRLPADRRVGAASARCCCRRGRGQRARAGAARALGRPGALLLGLAITLPLAAWAARRRASRRCSSGLSNYFASPARRPSSSSSSSTSSATRSPAR